MDRRSFLVTSSSALALGTSGILSGASGEPTPAPMRAEPDRRIAGDTITVYATASDTDLRLSRTDTLTFERSGQPLETQICVFVDPSKTYQSFVGIGGAITDASAETFAKLPSDKQQEL
ncbi:MAG TPA: hypothetical protein VFP90_14375, partial [Gemmatimonadaceae bacterium]|nr:hypothetical protein [Gemmatimonadaceae bacterium]